MVLLVNGWDGPFLFTWYHVRLRDYPQLRSSVYTLFMHTTRFLSVLITLVVASWVHAIDVPDGFRFDTDVPYGTQSERQRLDILYPETPDTTPRPVIVHIHGGGWYTGGKGGERTFAMMARLAEAGYVVTSIEYRLSDAAHFPAAVEDCKLAVRWLRAHADRYRINPDFIAAIGASAGGHLTAMLAVTRPEDGLDGRGGYPGESSAVQAAVPVAAHFDLTAPLSLAMAEKDDPLVVRFLGGPIADNIDAARRASPVTYARKDLPPMLVVQGTADKRVDRRTQADVMIESLTRAGAPVETIFVEGGGHGMGIARELETLRRIIDFLDQVRESADVNSATRTGQ